MRQQTQAKLDEVIGRLGGEAKPEESSPRSATAPERDAGEEEAVPVAPPPVDVGWHVWRYRLDDHADPVALEQRSEGVVVDVGVDEVVVARSRARQRRMEAWCEVWPLDHIDPASAVSLPSSKRIQAAKRLCGVIEASINSGRWSDKEEALLMAAVRLTAPYAPGRAA